MLPKLPKYTPVVGFGAKNGFFQKAVFDVNKWPCHAKSPWDGKAGRQF
jgi:hypothetical protein